MTPEYRREALTFCDGGVTRDQFVAACLFYEGVAYNAHQTQVWIDGGRPRGFMNCYGLPLLGCMACGMLPDDFDVNLHPQYWGQSIARTLRHVLTLNGERRMGVNSMRPGDIILMRYQDVDPKLTTPHHVGVCIERVPYEINRCSILHAEATRPDGVGCVHRSMIGADANPIMWNRVAEVWAMYNFRD